MATAYRAREQIEREGPNEQEGRTPVSLEDARRQKTRQLVLPLDGRGEAPRCERSGEASTAASGNERPGTGRRARPCPCALPHAARMARR